MYVYMYNTCTDPEYVSGAGSLTKEVLDGTDVASGASKRQDCVVVVGCVSIHIRSCNTNTLPNTLMLCACMYMYMYM